MKRILLAGLLAAAAVVVPTPAQAADCPDSSVTVVVQFPDQSIEIGCTQGDPANGLDALTSAGFAWTPVPSNPAAVCRIKGSPADNCWGGKYWVYFHAKPGGSWSYANTGGAGYDPKPGTVEGWRFGTGANTPPTIKPPGGAVTAPKPKPTPTAKPTRKPSVRPTAKPTVGPTQATPSASATTPTTTAAPSSSATAAETSVPSQSPSAADPTAASAQSATTSEASAAAPDKGISWVWGLALLGVLAAAGATTAVVRRRG